MRWILTFLFLASGMASAQVADLGLSITLDTEQPVPPGIVGEIAFTFTNDGPEAIRPVAVGLVLGMPVSFAGPRDETCFFAVTDITGRPPRPSAYFYGFSLISALAPNQSVTCTGLFSTSSALKQPIVVEWEVRGENFQGTDPNPSNNSVTTIFGIAQPIPASNTVGYLILLLLILLTARPYLVRSLTNH